MIDQSQKKYTINNGYDINWHRYKILVAEDEDTNYIYLKTALMKTGVALYRAINGKEAVEMILTQRLNVDLILMDIKMPVMDGIEATRTIMSHNMDIPIIAQTAFVSYEDRINCESVGCIDFIPKPILANLLFETLRKHLKQD